MHIFLRSRLPPPLRTLGVDVECPNSWVIYPAVRAAPKKAWATTIAVHKALGQTPSSPPPELPNEPSPPPKLPRNHANSDRYFRRIPSEILRIPTVIFAGFRQKSCEFLRLFPQDSVRNSATSHSFRRIPSLSNKTNL